MRSLGDNYIKWHFNNFFVIINTSKISNKVVASSAMAKSTQHQERLKENKPIEIPKLKERLVHLS
jgi:hypothetical protein